MLIAGSQGEQGNEGCVPSAASVELYDPGADTFSTTGSMAHARYDHAASLLLSGDVLVTGGFQVNMGGPPCTSAAIATAEVYDGAAAEHTDGGAGANRGGTTGDGRGAADGGGESSGCGCRTASSVPLGGTFGLVLAATVGVGRRRRSRAIA